MEYFKNKNCLFWLNYKTFMRVFRCLGDSSGKWQASTMHTKYSTMGLLSSFGLVCDAALQSVPNSTSEGITDSFFGENLTQICQTDQQINVTMPTQNIWWQRSSYLPWKHHQWELNCLLPSITYPVFTVWLESIRGWTMVFHTCSQCVLSKTWQMDG